LSTYARPVRVGDGGLTAGRGNDTELGDRMMRAYGLDPDEVRKAMAVAVAAPA
jgi:hypothetical protein